MPSPTSASSATVLSSTPSVTRPRCTVPSPTRPTGAGSSHCRQRVGVCPLDGAPRYAIHPSKNLTPTQHLATSPPDSAALTASSEVHSHALPARRSPAAHSREHPADPSSRSSSAWGLGPRSAVASRVTKPSPSMGFLRRLPPVAGHHRRLLRGASAPSLPPRTTVCGFIPAPVPSARASRRTLEPTAATVCRTDRPSSLTERPTSMEFLTSKIGSTSNLATGASAPFSSVVTGFPGVTGRQCRHRANVDGTIEPCLSRPPDDDGLPTILPQPRTGGRRTPVP